MANVRFTWNTGQISVLLHSQAGETGREVRRRGNLVLNQARRNAPVDTGALRASLFLRMTTVSGEVAAFVGTNIEHAWYVHEGTGLYGPNHRMIRPVRARMLAWQSGGRWHFARQVRGMRPRPFLRDALDAAGG